MRFVRAIALGLVAGAAVLPAAAAVLEVQVLRRDGGPVEGQLVELAPWGDFPPTGARGRPGPARGTDARGVARFEELAAGSYRVLCRPPEGSQLLVPGENPFVAPPVATLVHPWDEARVQVELWPGTRVYAQMAFDRAEVPRTAVRFEHLETGTTLEREFDTVGLADLLLAPGRWRASPVAAPGYLLLDFVVDGRSREGSDTVLDVDETGLPRYLAWHYAAEAKITGTITSRGAVDGALDIVATLQEPGAWIAEAGRRGGSRLETVFARWITRFRFEIDLPSGTWELRPTGARLGSSEPESETVVLAEGQTVDTYFELRFEEPEEVAWLYVDVRTGHDEAVPAAVVEVRSLEDGTPGRRLAREKTGPEGQAARFRDLDAGDYVIVAGHPRLLEGRSPLTGYVPTKSEGRRVLVTLEEGSRIRARASDPAGRPVTDVDFIVERAEAPPPLLLEDAGVRESRTHRQAPTDATGHVALDGLYPGVYAMGGRLRGELAARRFVRIGWPDEADPGDSLQARIGPGERAEVWLHVQPAASVEATVICSDGGPLPAATDVRAFPYLGAGRPPPEDPEPAEDASLALDDVQFLAGGRRLLAGPLDGGTFLLALRPVGYTRWTWALGEEDADRAAVFDARVGQTTDLGVVAFECAPAAELRPVVLDGSPLPDLREAKVSVVATRVLDNPENSTVEPRVIALRDAILVRDVPRGAVRIDFRVEHPHLVPDGHLGGSAIVEGQRGSAAPVALELPSVGGAIFVHGPGIAARVRGVAASTPPRVLPLKRGRARFMGLAPGTYEVATCADAACETRAHGWGSVTLGRGKTVRLEADERSGMMGQVRPESEESATP